MTNNVLFEELEGKEGNIGLVILKPSGSFNALNQEMCLQ